MRWWSTRFRMARMPGERLTQYVMVPATDDMDDGYYQNMWLNGLNVSPCCSGDTLWCLWGSCRGVGQFEYFPVKHPVPSTWNPISGRGQGMRVEDKAWGNKTTLQSAYSQKWSLFKLLFLFFTKAFFFFSNLFLPSCSAGNAENVEMSWVFWLLLLLCFSSKRQRCWSLVEHCFASMWANILSLPAPACTPRHPPATTTNTTSKVYVNVQVFALVELVILDSYAAEHIPSRTFCWSFFPPQLCVTHIKVKRGFLTDWNHMCLHYCDVYSFKML